MSCSPGQELTQSRKRWLWSLYNVGNSAYAAVVILAIYAAYFKGHVVGGAEGTRLWGISVGIAMLVVALAPPGRSAEFYGFFAVAGRTSSFIGPTIYGFVAAEAAISFEAQGEGASFLWFKLLEGGAPFAEQLGQRVAILPVILFLIVGTGLLLGVNEKKAREWVEEPVSS